MEFHRVQNARLPKLCNFGLMGNDDETDNLLKGIKSNGLKNYINNFKPNKMFLSFREPL